MHTLHYQHSRITTLRLTRCRPLHGICYLHWCLRKSVYGPHPHQLTWVGFKKAGEWEVLSCTLDPVANWIMQTVAAAEAQ